MTVMEDQLEQLCLYWFKDNGWVYRYGPDIAPDGDMPERADYRQVILQGRFQEALRRLYSGMSEPVLDEVLHRVIKLQEPSLVQCGIEGLELRVRVD